MKILQITASYKPAFVYGGPVMSVAKLCEEIMLKAESKKQKAQNDKFTAQQTHPQPSVAKSQLSKPQITVYTTLANGKEELPYKNGDIKIVDGVEVHYFKRATKDHGHFSPALLWKLWKTVKQFDIIHIHAWWNLVTMPACFVVLFRGCKVIITPRGTLSTYSFQNNNNKLKFLFHKWVGKSLLNKTYFHCTSRKEVTDTEVLLNPKAIFNIPNFVELPWEHKFSKDKDNDCLHLIFLSRIERKKGLELLFEALATHNFNWKLSVVGNGELSYAESLRQKAKSLKIDDKINWMGAVYGNEKFGLMAQHDYLILPSYDENFANVVIESLFVGTPVLITKNVGLSDYVALNHLGLVCERSFDGMIEILENANEAKKARNFNPEKLTNTIKQDFAEDKLRERYLEMYHEVLDKKFV
ncbi:glycosyltransferase [Pedobacter sp. SD-b]|uniref:Glycosyltransferase n=1 Tax=Pedobacter segetis TaxID=2793069 RepID=A0ABS1BGQ9_9SPHI|nr:glycosyltransferase [Pedobacter segetis]MBK0382055.1 glycosyltransferase [Pedobacter segetis]